MSWRVSRDKEVSSTAKSLIDCLAYEGMAAPLDGLGTCCWETYWSVSEKTGRCGVVD